jgi:hypothetical protein
MCRAGETSRNNENNRRGVTEHGYMRPTEERVEGVDERGCRNDTT